MTGRRLRLSGLQGERAGLRRRFTFKGDSDDDDLTMEMDLDEGGDEDRFDSDEDYE